MEHIMKLLHLKFSYAFVIVYNYIFSFILFV